ncbi:response regulator [Candidatus Electronema sp. JM]|uniref:response regulator n=1 Tax=Candidatus Electronema sp. JM TaxID=3401571 RepID=UPI003AA9754E
MRRLRPDKTSAINGTCCDKDGDSMAEGRPQTILVIDDDFANRRVLQLLLKRNGYVAVLAGDGCAGLRLARETQPDLVLLDFFMPGEDGFEVLAQFKADSALRDIPVVIFTVLVREESERQALELGAAAYVTKPFDIDEVITCIRRILP